MKIKDPVEQRGGEAPPSTENEARRTEEDTLPHGENDEKLLKPKRSCLNCVHLGEDWTCRVEGRKEIGNPFEEKTDCSDWKPVGASLGFIQAFPPCTPEYDAIVQETVEKALADYSGQEGTEKDDLSVQSGNSPRQRTQKK